MGGVPARVCLGSAFGKENGSTKIRLGCRGAEKLLRRVLNRATPLRMLSIPPLPREQPERPESGAWDAVRGGWRLLYGGLETCGFSMEWHDFEPQQEIDWARSFHRESVELCLNLTGSGEVRQASRRLQIQPNAAAFYAPAEGRLQASRGAGERHRFATVEWSKDFLATNAAACEADLAPSLRQALFGRGKSGSLGTARPLTQRQHTAVAGLVEPPVPLAAHALWYHGKMLQLMAEFLFQPAQEMFCARQKRVARERVESAKALLRERFTDPPSIEELGQHVGVSSFYLSRTFSQEVGMTIPQYVRQIRMERAAELLLGGGHNVTEAAFEVGYSSLGHFSKSFCEVIGCCPTLYPHAKHLRR